MKKALLIGVLVVFMAISNSTYARSYRSSSSDSYLRGYTKSNGTYVSPYYRSQRDGIKSNNYGCIDYGRCR